MELGHLLRSTVLAGSMLALGAGIAVAQDKAASPLDAMRPVSDDMLKAPDDGDWLMWRRTYDGWGYSPLDEINKDNVKDLRVAWVWSLTNGARSERRPATTSSTSSTGVPSPRRDRTTCGSTWCR